MFESIIPKLAVARESRSVILPDGSRAPFSATRFSSVAAGEGVRACFIDGGNAPVFESPEARVEYVRLAAVAYEGRERAATHQEEGLLLIRYEGGAVVATGEEGFSLSVKAGVDDEELRLGREKVTLAAVAGLARFLLECSLVKRLASERSFQLVVRDGSLVGANRHEEEALARMRGSWLLAGLSKTSSLLTEQGVSASAELLARSPRDCWYALLGSVNGVVVGVARLQPGCERAFRLDVLGGEEEALRAARALALLSGDAAFPGYPYPLVEAHRLARVSAREAGRLRTRLVMEAGERWPVLQRLERGSDAHRILDRLS